MIMLKSTLSQLVLHYLRFLAKLQLKKNPRATIIGITGSAGKTSTRLALAQILKTRAIVKHSSHANSESGIPLNILGLSPRTYSALDWLRLIIMAPVQLLAFWEHFDYYVVEMGIDGPDSPQNMSYLLSIIRPHVAVVLNASLAHSGPFDHLVKDTTPSRRSAKLIKLIAKEKMKLARGISPAGVAVVNLDQKELLGNHSGIASRLVTFGKSKGATLRLIKSEITNHGFTLHFIYQAQSYSLTLPDVFSEQYAYTFAAAISAAAALGIPPSRSMAGLSDYHAPAGRLRLFPGIENSTIIDSSYNASPATMLESLTLLKKLAGRHKKIAVIGDMRELGQSEKIVHKNLADWLILYCDEVILFGDSTLAYTLPVLLSKNFPAHHFTHMSDLTKYLHSHLSPHSYILIKGSQNTILLERSVEAILKNTSDVSHLCRRGAYWDHLRAKTP